MKTKSPITLALAGLMTASLAGTLQASELGRDMNLFETPGKKETSEDFKPAPERIETNFGALEFTGGAFPTQASVQRGRR